MYGLYIAAPEIHYSYIVLLVTKVSLKISYQWFLFVTLQALSDTSIMIMGIYIN